MGGTGLEPVTPSLSSAFRVPPLFGIVRRSAQLSAFRAANEDTDPPLFAGAAFHDFSKELSSVVVKRTQDRGAPRALAAPAQPIARFFLRSYRSSACSNASIASSVRPAAASTSARSISASACWTARPSGWFAPPPLEQLSRPRRTFPLRPEALPGDGARAPAPQKSSASANSRAPEPGPVGSGTGLPDACGVEFAAAVEFETAVLHRRRLGPNLKPGVRCAA